MIRQEDEAVKELQAENERLGEQVKGLEERMAALERAILRESAGNGLPLTLRH